jgi:gluconolactonase
MGKRFPQSQKNCEGPGDTGPGGKGVIYVFDVGVDNKLSNQKLFTDCVVDGVKCGPDGMRCLRVCLK